MIQGEGRGPDSTMLATRERPDETEPPEDRPRRDVAIDRLRGLCLLSMTVGHLAVTHGDFSPLNTAVHAPAWVTGAAGFIFLSGVSVGLLWTARGGCTPTMRRWTATRALFLVAIGYALNGGGILWFNALDHPSWDQTVPPTAVSVLTGRWWLVFTDVMGLYTVFLLAAAIAGPWIVARPRSTLLASGGLYAVSLVAPGFGPTPSPGEPPVWDLLAWQIVFIPGLVAGCRWRQVQTWLSSHRVVVMSLGAAGVVIIAGLRLAFNLAESGVDPIGFASARAELEAVWLAKEALGPARVLLIGLLGPAAYLMARRPLPGDRLITAAGARSLRVYLISTLAAFAWPAVMTAADWPTSDVAIAVITVLVLAVGLAPAMGRGRPWTI